MSVTGDFDEDLLNVASLYYVQDVKMEEIAERLGTSRSSVSRMLKRARDCGLVEIALRPAEAPASGPEREIAQRFGARVHVVPVPGDPSPTEVLDQVALVAARLLVSWFDSDKTLGIAWGTTMAAVARNLPHRPTRGATVVQLNGSANMDTGGVEYAADLLAAFGTAFGASVHHFLVPAFFDYAETKQAMWRERSVKRVLDLQRSCDVALFSIGAISGPVPSHVYSGGYLDEEDVRTLREEGVAGDVTTVFLRADGSWEDLAINERATGPTPDELREVPRRVCVVAGEHKVVGLRAAMLAGVVTDLVIDEAAATRLAQLLREDDSVRHDAVVG